MGGSVPFPVVDNNGTETGYFVDMEPIHNAFLGLQRSVQSHDGQENLHFSILQKLIEEFSHSPKSGSSSRGFTSPRKGEFWRRSTNVGTRAPYVGRKFHGGEASSEQKNGFSPS